MGGYSGAESGGVKLRREILYLAGTYWRMDSATPRCKGDEHSAIIARQQPGFFILVNKFVSWIFLATLVA